MAVRIVQLGSARAQAEGLRLGTVRRPPRGIPKDQFAKRDYYDLWLPLLAPSPAAIKMAQSCRNDSEWLRFERLYRREMRKPEPKLLLDLLAAFSHQANFSIGCYCAEEARCHRSVLRALLSERGAALL